MKKTDLYKNQGLAVAHQMKNATKAKQLGKADTSAQKDALAKKNPLLASLMGKTESVVKVSATKTSKTKLSEKSKSK
ncbi:MAG: hypothetical protein JHC68_06685 [Polynucleobacter sp.]|jgi:hypothetical protein|nr:hypothetical protein [Polynucleobacter sp.]